MKVKMLSDLYGEDVFEYGSMAEALEAIKRLVGKSKKDEVERFIGIVVNED